MRVRLQRKTPPLARSGSRSSAFGAAAMASDGASPVGSRPKSKRVPSLDCTIQRVESGERKNRMKPPSTRARYCCQPSTSACTAGALPAALASMAATAAVSTGTSS